MKAAKLNDESVKRHLLKENNGIQKFQQKYCENVVVVAEKNNLQSFAKIDNGNAVRAPVRKRHYHFCKMSFFSKKSFI